MAASALGRSLEILTARTNQEITAAFTSAVQKRTDALFVMGDPLFTVSGALAPFGRRLDLPSGV